MGLGWTSKDPVEPEHGKSDDGQDDGSAGTTRDQHLDDAHHDHHQDDEDGIT